MENILKQIASDVIEMEEDLIVDHCEMALRQGLDPKTIIEDGLIAGMNTVSDYFEDQTYFLPEILICSDTFNLGLAHVKPHLKPNENEKNLKIVIGVVEGDTHDIGKNIVKIMMESAGFQVHDLGRDVPLQKFVDCAEEIEADIICMSTLMTTTMFGMKIVIDELKQRNIRHKYKVMVGGGPLSKSYAQEIGADLYTKDASEAVRCLKAL